MLEMLIATVFPRLNPDPFGMILASVIQLPDVQTLPRLVFALTFGNILKNCEVVVTAKSEYYINLKG